MNRQALNRRKKSGFYFRGFTTFALSAAAFVIAASGVALFATPRGRVAHWTHWTLAGLEKGRTLWQVSEAVQEVDGWWVQNSQAAEEGFASRDRGQRVRGRGCCRPLQEAGR